MGRIAEFDFDPVSKVSTLLREYVWFEGKPIAVIEDGVVYYVRSDHIGKPVFATDATGAKVWEASYLPFGGMRMSSGANIDLRFPGQWFQSENGLHQNWMREYDPTTGRYIQADPLGLVDGASVYGYAGQNPNRYTDPTGEFIPAWAAAAAAAAGGMINVGIGYTIDQIWGDGCYTWEDALLDFGWGAAFGMGGHYYNLGKVAPWAAVAGQNAWRGAGTAAAARGAAATGGPAATKRTPQTLAERGADLVARNGGKNRVPISTPNGRMNIDLAGKPHNVNGVNVPTPNGPRSGQVGSRSRLGDIRPATDQDLRIVDRYLGSLGR